MHSDWGCALAKKISKTSGEYHHHDRNSKEIREELIKYAKNLWSQGIEAVLFGHYHQIGIKEFNEHRLIWMGDWISYFSVTVRDDKGWRQLNWEKDSKFNSKKIK